MKSILRMSLFVLTAGLLFGAALAVFDHGEVRVESKDGRYHSVRVNTGGYVRLVRTLSDAPCREGRNWGYDGGRIWVDDGCRAVFAFGRDSRWDRDDRWNNGRWDDDCCDGHRRGQGHSRNCRHHDNGRYDRVVRVRLESEHRRKEARFIPNRDVRIVRKLSDAPCREGYSWGHNDRFVWVDRGCRADFQVWTR